MFLWHERLRWQWFQNSLAFGSTRKMVGEIASIGFDGTNWPQSGFWLACSFIFGLIKCQQAFCLLWTECIPQCLSCCLVRCAFCAADGPCMSCLNIPRHMCTLRPCEVERSTEWTCQRLIWNFKRKALNWMRGPFWLLWNRHECIKYMSSHTFRGASATRDGSGKHLVWTSDPVISPNDIGFLIFSNSR